MTALTTLILSAVIGCLVSLLIEQGLTPRPRPFWQRPAGTLIHMGIWLLGYLLLITLLLRPLYACTVLLAVQLFLLTVNRVKYTDLREPFLLQDFEYFVDMLRHPRLYIPFFGLWRTLAAIGGGGIVLIGGALFEPPLHGDPEEILTLYGIIIPVMIALLWGLIRLGQRNKLTQFNPSSDLRNWGQLPFFWLYGQALFSKQPPPQANPIFDQPLPMDSHRPNILLIQSESFFDPRPLHEAINPEILANFDALCLESIQHGELQVPAWGANTVRTECAVLTGLKGDQLGIQAFSPYRWLVKHPLNNLAEYLRQQGYRTLCIHPYPASFYLRETLFPKLGFDHFIDVTSFSDEEKDGQYISDAAVMDRIEQLLGQTNDQPLFVFVITMENHGPLHLEHPRSERTTQLTRSPLPPGCDELAVYLHHLNNADKMLIRAAESLTQSQREGILVWYGDHIPIMPSTFAQIGEPNGDTRYLLWRTDLKGQEMDTTEAKPVRLCADKLAGLLLNQLTDQLLDQH